MEIKKEILDELLKDQDPKKMFAMGDCWAT